MTLTHRIFAQSIRDMRTVAASETDAAAMRLRARLLEHAALHVPFYAPHRATLAEAARGDPLAWQSLPVLSAREIAASGPALVSTIIPVEVEWLSEQAWTSLSTPMDDPADLLGDVADKGQWEFALRHAGIDATSRLAAILPPTALRADDLRDQVEPWSLDHTRGKAHRWSEEFDPRATLLWLRHIRPAIVFLRVPVLQALFEVARPDDLTLAHVLTYGTPAMPDTCERCRETFGASLLDVITASPCGFVASREPTGGFMPANETVFVEIVDANGRSCQPGEAGWLVATALYGYARVALRQNLGIRAAWLPAAAQGRRLFRLAPSC